MFRVTYPLSRRMAFYFLLQNSKMMAPLESITRFLARFCKEYDPPSDLTRPFDWSGIRFDRVPDLDLKSREGDKSDDPSSEKKYNIFTFYIVLHEALPPDGIPSAKHIGCCLHPQKAKHTATDHMLNLFE